MPSRRVLTYTALSAGLHQNVYTRAADSGRTFKREIHTSNGRIVDCGRRGRPEPDRTEAVIAADIEALVVAKRGRGFPSLGAILPTPEASLRSLALWTCSGEYATVGRRVCESPPSVSLRRGGGGETLLLSEGGRALASDTAPLKLPSAGAGAGGGGGGVGTADADAVISLFRLLRHL